MHHVKFTVVIPAFHLAPSPFLLLSSLQRFLSISANKLLSINFIIIFISKTVLLSSLSCNRLVLIPRDRSLLLPPFTAEILEPAKHCVLSSHTSQCGKIFVFKRQLDFITQLLKVIFNNSEKIFRIKISTKTKTETYVPKE